jgi:predicted permease
MRALREWIHRFWATVRPGRPDDDLAEELRLHLEMVAEAAERRGHDPNEAVRIARMEAGGSSQAMDAVRDQRGLPWLEDVARDVSYGLRMLKRRPGFTATATLSLALGIGANAGIFSLVDQALLRVLPVREPEQLVLLNWRGNSLSNTFGGAPNFMSYSMCRDLQEQNQFFDGVLCRASWEVNFSTGQQYERARAEMVSGSYFSVLGVRPELGRLIGASDDVRPGDHPVVVLSFDYWKNRLGGADDVVGRMILLNNFPMTVIGVAASGFRGMDAGEPATLWIPAVMAREATLEFNRILDRRVVWMHVYGRLKARVTSEQAKNGLQPWFTSMLEADTRREDFPRATPEQRREFLASTIDVLPGAQGWSSLRGSLARPLWLLMAGTTLLLLLACLNVASLLLARGAERTQELTTRMALGASQGRISRQLIVESLLIALVGGLLGLMASLAVSRVVLLFIPEGVNLTPTVDHRVFLFSTVASIVVGVLCGLAPALQAGRRQLAPSINGRSTATGTAVRFRKVIVAAQLALTLVLLAGAGLFVQTLTRLYARDRGFESSSLVMFRADPARTGYPESDAPRIMREILRTLQDVSGIERVALANNSLLGGAGPSRSLTIGADRRTIAEFVPAMRISEGFFSTIGVRVIAGREFDEHDTRDVDKTGIRSVIVNEAFAKRYFGRDSPIAQHVGIGTRPDTATDIEIIGVVNDFSRRLLRDDRQPEHVFIPFAQAGPDAGDGTFYVKARGEAESALALIRATVADVDPRLPLTGLTTLDDQVNRALQSERMLATLSSGFGSVALLLSVVGLFGVMSFVVTQRTQEIGMRMALGATRSSAIWLIVRDALVTIGFGAAAGIVIAVTAGLLAAPRLTSVLYGVTPSDTWTLAATTTLLTVVGLAACAAPAWRASLLSPMSAIRNEPVSMWQAARVKVGTVVRELSHNGEPAVPLGPLISEFAESVRCAVSSPEATQVALAALQKEIDAQSVTLLEKASDEEYRCEQWALPAQGFLLRQLKDYPHPMTLTDDAFATWLRWAREFRPDRTAEIERLANSGARIAVPLRTKNEIVGVLLLGPPTRRERYTAPEEQLLSSAADVFALLIENARLNERALEQEKLRRDLALAAEVQRRLLPAQPPTCAAATFAAFTLPARTVGGDYYDFLDLASERIGIAVADIAGKGIAAALLMSAVQASLRVMTTEHDLPTSQLAAQMNRFLYASTATSSYATFFYGQLDFRSRRLCYVNAGHNPPYLVRRIDASVEITELSVGGTVLGLFPDVVYENGNIDLRPGDLLVAFTDGVTEALNVAGEEFGEERLKDLLRGAVHASAEEISSTLAHRIREWIAGTEQYDDVTFVIAAVN